MADINRVIISGRLTRDPELRQTAGGTPVLGMGVAVNDRRRNFQTGQWEDYTNFIDCTMFGARAESLSRILTKGMLVCIEGRLRWSQWERDGQKRSKIEVIVDELELPSRGQGAQDGASSQGGSLLPSSRTPLPRMPLHRSSNSTTLLLRPCRPQTRFTTRRFRSRNPQPFSLRI